MDDQQKTRLVVIGLAGLCLIAVGGWWMMSQNNKAENADQANSAKQATPGTTPVNATTATTTPAGATPAGTPGSAPGSAASNTAATGATATPAGAAPTSAASTAYTKDGSLPGMGGLPVDQTATSAPPAQPAAQTTIASATLPGSAPISAAPSGGSTSSSGAVNKYPATKREEAASAARQVAGREDPMVNAFEKIPYPGPWTKAGAGLSSSSSSSTSSAEDKAATLAPPPPPPTSEKALPPAPPATATAAPELPIENMPLPPDKPMVTPKLKLTAILGTKAVLSVPLELRAQNKWPAVICLGPGERFEDPTNGSFSVVSVDPDSVTIEEEQERSVKSLPQIK